MKSVSIKRNPRFSKLILVASFLGCIALYAFWSNSDSLEMDASPVIMLTIYFVIFLPKMLWNIRKPKTILILCDRGIHCLYGGTLPNTIVSWDYFECFRPIEAEGTPYIELRLKDKETFATDFPDFYHTFKKKREDWKLPIGLFPTLYAIKPEELLILLGQWLPQKTI